MLQFVASVDGLKAAVAMATATVSTDNTTSDFHHGGLMSFL